MAGIPTISIFTEYSLSYKQQQEDPEAKLGGRRKRFLRGE